MNGVTPPPRIRPIALGLDPRVYYRAEFKILEADATRTIATWKSLDELAAGGTLLYPQGLLELLTGAR